MTRRRGWARQLWDEQPGLHRGYIVDVATAVVLALALILGGRERTVAVAWRTLNANGGPLLWGVVFAVVAALLVIAPFVSGWAMMLALGFAAVPYALLGWWFLYTAAVVESSSSFVGAVLCIRTAIMHISRGDAYRVGPRGALGA